MTYTTPTPSTVSAGDTFPASAYNIISADLQDHETRIKTGVESYTTTQKTALTGVTTGTMVYDSTLNRFETYNGTAWVLTTTPPSLTTTQKTALSSSPYAVAAGTMVYDSTLGRLQMWNGTSWGEPWASNNLTFASYNVQSTTTAGSAWVSAGFSATITPRSATSKVLVQPCIHAALFRGNVTGVSINFRIKRDGVVVYNATSNIGAMNLEAGVNVNTAVSMGGFINVQFMDTPATTSAISYTFECQNAASGTLYVNYSGGTATTSSAIVTEITA